MINNFGNINDVNDITDGLLNKDILNESDSSNNCKPISKNSRLSAI